MTPTAAPLDAAILEGAIRSVNFFNGRLLTGEDLSREQEAARRARAQFGQACGEGVAHGLEVKQAAASTDARPVLEVAAGLAVNGRGQTLELAEPTDLALTRERGEGEEAEVTFADCAPLEGGGTFTAGAGIYMLTILPARTSEGLARVSGLLNEESTCASDTSVETVKFRLCRLHLRHQDVAEADRIRNRLAHLAYGSYDPRLREFPRDPFAQPVERYGLLDDLRVRSLTPEEVPLAMLRWTAVGGLRFVDLWSVRRRLTRAPAARRWPTLVGDRRRSEAEAMFLQFGQQVEDALGGETGLDEIAAGDRFDFLPPVGILPIAGDGSEQGFDPETFFGAQASRDVAMTDGRLLAELVEDSLVHEPIQVGSSEKVQLYRIWENDQAVQAGLTGQRTMAFAKGTLRYRGIARFGYARWNLSRFAPHVT